MADPLDKDVDEARAEWDAGLRAQEERQRQQAAEDQRMLRDAQREQAELREAAQAFIARVRRLGVEPIPMRFATEVVERFTGFFGNKREIVWQYRETSGWQVQVAHHPQYPSEHDPRQEAIAVTVDGSVYVGSYQERWPAPVGLRLRPVTDPITQDDHDRPVSGIPGTAAGLRKAMAKFLVAHGG